MNHRKAACVRSQVLVLFTLPALVLAAGTAHAQKDLAAGAGQSDCAYLQQNSYPKTTISNGQVNAVVYLPDPENGYNRGDRFDWSGVVGCLAYKGHTYFGVWFPHYDPLLHDSITGPVEEFRSSDGALNYGQAKAGDLFVKVGVGVLRKIDDKPYDYTFHYPLIDGGKWTVHSGKDWVSFRQDLNSKVGYSYIYKKNLKLEKNEPVLVVQHELINTGKKTIDTEVYDHDFYMLDGAPTGPGIEVRFRFDPKADRDLGNGARIDGKEIVFDRELQTGQSAFGFITGFSNDVSDYDITVENQKTGVGVEQTGDTPISRVNFWSIRTTICPEAYIHLIIPPGESAHWTIRYRFFAK
jgi:hypothetical protein